MLCADLVEVCWSDETGRPYCVTANLEEISQHGAHFVLEQAVPVATELVLHMKPGDVTATVRDCRHEPDFGFAIGVQLPRKFRWKAHPRHLFDPRGLARREAMQNRSRNLDNETGRLTDLATR